MVGKTFSASLQGIDGAVIEIEASCQRAIPKIQITGLPGEIVKESRERIRAALSNLGFEIPTSQLLVHLSPATTRKQGSQLDLAIAIGVLMAEGCLEKTAPAKTAFLGELCLDGRIQPVVGAIALLQALEKRPEIEHIILPRGNAWEASLACSRKARIASHLGEVLDYLRGHVDLSGVQREAGEGETAIPAPSFALDDVVGQRLAKRALQIAVAGRHHLLMAGPPGVGKSLLAGCAPRLLPPLSSEEMVEVLKNHTHCLSARRSPAERPFRSPHHSISAGGLLGGGSGVVIPGEVTLAHAGVLFLDEFPEFRKDVIEGLREPLQNGVIHLHRVGSSATLPARFTLIAAMNPCPCGYSLGSIRRCTCTREAFNAYRKRISGPIVDRMDLSVVLGAPKGDEPAGPREVEMKEAVSRAWEIQHKRYGGPGIANGDASVDLKHGAFALDTESSDWFTKLSEGGCLSYRSLHKLIRVARTIADLEAAPSIALCHLREAWALRCDLFA